MGIGDKISGRIKQAGGDLLGDEDLHREGAQEERKGDAKEEAAREEARAEQVQADAERRQETAEQRAAAAAEREFEKADREIEGQQVRAEAADRRAERKDEEVESLERSTNPDALADDRTKDELYDRAQELGVQGRSDMSKEELAEEVTRRQ